MRYVNDVSEPHDFLADCRARLTFDLLSHTWNAVVLWALRHGPRRPGELRGRIGGISAKVLTETLRRLEYNGLVDRRAYAGSPPRVEYGLTALGESLLPPIEAFGVWAAQHGDEVLAAQDRADAAAPPLERPPLEQPPLKGSPGQHP
ncbi:helix-turn-helix domain-containing protein [Streptomyces sp. PmtG]